LETPTCVECLAIAPSMPNNRIEEILALLDKVDRLFGNEKECDLKCECVDLGTDDLFKDLEDGKKEV
jgi:hypothetical protein